jgi:hypothetical protein
VTTRLRTTAIAIAVTCVTVAALPFHIAVMEWMLTQGDMFLSFCGQLLGGPGSAGPAPLH